MEVTATATRSERYGDRRLFRATVQLLYRLGQNDRPYFSATAEDLNLRRRGDNQIESRGCLHEDIVKHFPEFAPVVLVHLADDRGRPMHDKANALYWGGFSPAFPRVKDGEPWRQMVPSDNYGRTPLETDSTGLQWSPTAFARHMRVSEDRGREMRTYVANDETQHYSAAMHFICQMMRDEWQLEANRALEVIRAHERPSDA